MVIEDIILRADVQSAWINQNFRITVVMRTRAYDKLSRVGSDSHFWYVCISMR